MDSTLAGIETAGKASQLLNADSPIDFTPSAMESELSAMQPEKA